MYENLMYPTEETRESCCAESKSPHMVELQGYSGICPIFLHNSLCPTVHNSDSLSWTMEDGQHCFHQDNHSNFSYMPEVEQKTSGPLWNGTPSGLSYHCPASNFINSWEGAFSYQIWTFSFMACLHYTHIAVRNTQWGTKCLNHWKDMIQICQTWIHPIHNSLLTLAPFQE
jgi:hypothetical protein